MSIIEAIKDQVDITVVAEKYMRLKRFGGRYKGLCPFHSERTPSFTIYGDSGRYKCFGCGASGDVINLWAHFNNVDTATAIRQLKAEYGVNGGSELSERAIRRQANGFIRQKREEMREILQQWLNTLEGWMRHMIKTNDDLERWGDLYHVITTCELWLNNIDHANTAELRNLYECIPRYVLDIYKKYWKAVK